jgi:hypothetical protein
MTDLQKNILAALIELENTVKGMAQTQPKPDLQPLFTQLEELTRQLPKTTDADLLHYLHRKSYQKARLYLEGRDAR